MPAGRPPKPTELKKRQGNPGKRPLPGGGELAVVPPAEIGAWEKPARQVMSEVMAAGVAWIATTDTPKAALLLEALEDYERLRSTPGTPPKEIRDARKEISGLMSELGFDPTARARLGLAEVKAQAQVSKLEEMRRKRDG